MFFGFQPTFYSGLRDADGNQLGYIEPGEIVDIAEAPDSSFAPVDIPDSAPASASPADDAGIPVDPAPIAPPLQQAAPTQVNPAAAAVVH